MSDIQNILDDAGFGEWTADDDGAVFTCPHGNRVEPDGTSGDCGCESPLLTLGMI